MFKNRTEAGKVLAKKLQPFKGKDTVVLSILERALPVGKEISKILDSPLEIFLCQKISHPKNREYFIGTVSLEGEVWNDVDSQIEESYLDQEVKKARRSLRKKKREFYRERMPLYLKNKQLIICDDGIASGETMLETLELLKERMAKKIIVAVPVASPSGIKKVRDSPYVSEVISVDIPEGFYSIGADYESFDPVNEEEAFKIFDDM